MRTIAARRLAAVTTVAGSAVLALAAPAFAHVTVQPGAATQGGYTAVAFRVPDESDTASTTKVEVSLPLDHPLASVRTMPLPGWTAVLEKTKLATPIKTESGQIIEAVSKITWTADATAKVGPGQFQEFKVSLGPLPTDADSMTFKALQTYDNGQVVRWIDEAKDGQPEPAHPAPVLTLAKAATGAAAGGHGMGAASQDTKSSDTATAKSSDNAARTLGVVGIVVGVIGAALGVAGLRRKSTGTAS